MGKSKKKKKQKDFDCDINSFFLDDILKEIKKRKKSKKHKDGLTG